MARSGQFRPEEQVGAPSTIGAGQNENTYPDAPGAGSPMAPGSDCRATMVKGTAAPMREKLPVYPTGTPGADSGNGRG